MNIPLPVHLYVVDPLERAVSTFVQQFVVLMLPFLAIAKFAVAGPTWLAVVDEAGFAALLSLVTSVLTFKVPQLDPALDLLLRVIKTFAQSFFGIALAATATPSLVHAPWENALATAFPVAMAALLKGLAALAAPWSDGASLIQAPLAETGGGDIDGELLDMHIPEPEHITTENPDTGVAGRPLPPPSPAPSPGQHRSPE